MKAQGKKNPERCLFEIVMKGCWGYNSLILQLLTEVNFIKKALEFYEEELYDFLK